MWGVKSVPGGFDSHMPPPKERFQIHCESDGSFLYHRKLHFLWYKKPPAGCALARIRIMSQATTFHFGRCWTSVTGAQQRARRENVPRHILCSIIGKNVRKCIFIYKNSLRKTKEIENRIFKIIREEKRKTINYRKLQKRTISYKNNRKTLWKALII